jgi:hypothetical protein
MGSICA